jgi:hypothetical protein
LLKHALDAFQTVLYSPTYGGCISLDQKLVGELSLVRLWQSGSHLTAQIPLRWKVFTDIPNP